MALRAGYYGVKRFLRDKLESIAGTYDETIDSKMTWEVNARTGVHNIMPKPLNLAQADAGITYTFNDDGTITANGTATNFAWLQIMNQSYFGSSFFKEVAGRKIILSGGVDANNIVIFRLIKTSGGTETDYISTGNEVQIDIPADIADYYRVTMMIQVANGETVDNILFKPMLRYAEDTVKDYAPYAMTNKELTDSASDQKTAINAIITAATGAADFAAFKTAMGAITPVTRSLSLTKGDIIEEVKEDVEPEKTVTKKRTTKKTEEV